jgi:hypothetical protein
MQDATIILSHGIASQKTTNLPRANEGDGWARLEPRSSHPLPRFSIAPQP